MIRAMRFVRIPAAAVAVALLVLLWGQNGPHQARAVFDDSDGDGFISVEEQIAGSDPNDPASVPEDLGLDLFFGSSTCSDGLDNDRDGLIDSADPSCSDSDYDFVSNAMETLLGSDPNDNTSYPESSSLDAVFNFFGIPGAVTCGDGQDGDRDGLIDGADPGCVQIQNDGDPFTDVTEKLFGSDPTNPNSVPEHDMPNPGSCSDGTDNDLDGLTDGADLGCQPALNDDFADATVITSLPFNQIEKINTATRQSSDPYPSCSPPPLMNVWYSYTAAADGVVVADAGGTNFDSTLSVWTPRGGRLAEIGCSSSFFLGPDPHLAFRAVAGQTYYVLIGGEVTPDAPANLSFHLVTGQPPANDDFTNAALISALPFISAASTLDATTEPNEPSCAYSRPISSVWYQFAPSQDTLVLLDASGSNFQAIIGAWTPTVFGLAQVACSFDNYSGQIFPRVAFVAEAGQTYYLQAGGFFYGPSSGNLALTVDVGIPPANDNFANATAITSLPFTDSVDAITATVELLEPVPSCVYGSMSQTIWYRYTATSDGYLVADTGDTGRYDLFIAAYQGSSLTNLTEVGCAQPYPPLNLAAFPVTAGQTYHIAVASQTFRGGKFGGAASGRGIPPPLPSTLVTFHIDTLVVPTCAPPTFAVTDPIGDQFGVFGPPPPGAAPPDITSVSGGSDGQNVCLDVQFAAPLPQPAQGEERPWMVFSFDADELPGSQMTCFNSYGSELDVYFSIPSNLLIQLYPYLPVPPALGYVIVGESSLRLIVPLSVLGGDDSFRVTVQANSGSGGDCAPNGGGIQSPVAASLGDANCDGQVDSVDSVLILQLFANLIGSLPCQYAGDVNDNGGVGPIDALLILQFSSGMLSTFPVQ